MFTVHPRFYLGDGKPVLGWGFHATASFTASKRRKTGCKGRGRLAPGRWLGQWDSYGRFCSRGMESKDTPAHRGATWHEARCIYMPGAITTLAELACPACPPDALMQRSSGISVVFAHACDVTTTGRWFGTWILFFHILGIIIPTDELIFFRGVAQPPTRQLFPSYHMWNISMNMSPNVPWMPLVLWKGPRSWGRSVILVPKGWNDEPQLRPFNSFRWLYMGLWFHKWGSYFTDLELVYKWPEFCRGLLGESSLWLLKWGCTPVDEVGKPYGKHMKWGEETRLCR